MADGPPLAPSYDSDLDRDPDAAADDYPPCPPTGVFCQYCGTHWGCDGDA